MPRCKQPLTPSLRRCSQHGLDMVPRGRGGSKDIYRCPLCVEIARAVVRELVGQCPYNNRSMLRGFSALDKRRMNA